MNKHKIKPTTRIHWVDILKFIGIFSIYLGHLFSQQSNNYHFIFLYNVPLFFFISGFFAQTTNQPLFVFYKEKIKRLMFPYLTFSLVALLYFSLLNRWGPFEIIGAAATFIGGIRGQVYALSLWFIPCLFIISIFHYTIQKLTKSNYVPLGVSILLFITSQTILPHNPLVKQSWFMNIDSAMYYYIFYAIGAVAFPHIKKEYSSLNTYQKTGRLMIGLSTILLTLIFYIIGDAWISLNIVRLFPYLVPNFEKIHLALLLPVGLIIIYTYILVAKLLSQVSLLERMGQETLNFCGTENVYKDFIFRFFGSAINLSSPISAFVFTFISLYISLYTIVPFFNKSLPAFVSKIGRRVLLSKSR